MLSQKKTTKKIPSIKKNNKLSAKKQSKPADLIDKTQLNKESIHQEQILIGFPNHLFKLENWDLTLNKNIINIHFILYEHPIFYGYRQTPGKLNYNKSRLIYVRAAILAYIDYLNKHLGTSITTRNGNVIKLLSVILIPVDDCLADKLAIGHQIQKLNRTAGNISADITYWDPVDNELSHKILESLIIPSGQTSVVSLNKLDSPLFLTPETELAEYNSKHSTGRFTHSAFYEWQKQRPTHKEFKFPGHSYDTENRGKMPLTTTIPPLPKLISTDTKYLKQAETYITTHPEWGNKTRPGAGNTLTNIVFPISHTTTLDWFQNFLAKKLGHFGKYQDSIDGQARNYLFHSCISPMMNLGLITPLEVITEAHKYYHAHSSAVGVANYEGFIRQVIGWREYQRYIYLYAGQKMRQSNHFNNHHKLTAKWYSGELGIRPVDDTIKMAFRDGYLHHILRLMVMGNFMNLAGIHPDEVYRWFMEFALDSYDWVMVGNVYSMALWADGGLSMRKPYISSDTYIMTLGTYTKESTTINHDQDSYKSSDASSSSSESSSNRPPSTTTNRTLTKPKLPKLASNLGWNRAWYVLFYDFINRSQQQLKSTYYAGLVKAWNNKLSTEKDQILSDAKSIIKIITN